jgi:hypothetical protein
MGHKNQNKMKNKRYDFEATQSLALCSSYGTIRQEKDVKLSVTVGIKDQHSGWFEIYDIKTGGEVWYAEGGLDFDGMDLVGYDGCFDLPNVIVDKLKELGYNDEL